MTTLLLLCTLPILLGIIIRLLFRKSMHDFLVTGAFGILVLIMAGISMFVPAHEVFGILTIMAAYAFAGSLTTGILLLLISVA